MGKYLLRIHFYRIDPNDVSTQTLSQSNEHSSPQEAGAQAPNLSWQQNLNERKHHGRR